ncbi:MAG: hypothetical protein QXT53_02310 [Ignisphaera sp.]
MEEEIISSETQEGREALEEESSEIYAESEEVEYVAFSPQELEMFILRSETWDRLVKGEITFEDAKKIIDAIIQQPQMQVETTKKRGRRKRKE